LNLFVVYFYRSNDQTQLFTGHYMQNKWKTWVFSFTKCLTNISLSMVMHI